MIRILSIVEELGRAYSKPVLEGRCAVSSFHLGLSGVNFLFLARSFVQLSDMNMHYQDIFLNVFVFLLFQAKTLLITCRLTARYFKEDREKQAENIRSIARQV